MFTGIIREVGRVRSVTRTGGGAVIEIEAPRTAPHVMRGASVAIDGVCLTVTEEGAATFSCDIVPETIARTTWDRREAGDRVNLEPSLRLGDSLDGHLVQGHVDGVGLVESVERKGLAWTVAIAPPAGLTSLIAEKGSVAVNGVSLTVAGTLRGVFTVALIPTTLEETNLKDLEKGTRVNLEADLLARYVARLLEGRQA